MGSGYIAYSRVNPALPKHLLVPVASLGCANTAVFMKMHLGFARTDFSRRHSTQEPSLAAIAGSGPQDDIFVAAHARGLPVATAFRGFMAC